MAGDSVHVKDELRLSHPVVEEAGQGLVWTGDSAASEPDAQGGIEAKRPLYTVLRAVMALL